MSHYHDFCTIRHMLNPGNRMNEDEIFPSISLTSYMDAIYEPPHGKTNYLHRRKQRRRSASL